MTDAARITTIANYIVDKAEAGWSLQDILDAIRADSSDDCQPRDPCRYLDYMAQIAIQGRQQ